MIRPDHPGYGWSDEDSRIDSVHDLAFFYLDLLDELGLDRVSVIGSSLGGWIGADLADDRAAPDHAPRADRRRRPARRGQRPAGRVRARARGGDRARLRRRRSTAARRPSASTRSRRTRLRWSATSATGSPPHTSPGTPTSTTRSSSTACTGSPRPRSSCGAREDGLVPLAHGHRWTELIPGSRLEVVDGLPVTCPTSSSPSRFLELVRPFLRPPNQASEITVRYDRSLAKLFDFTPSDPLQSHQHHPRRQGEGERET